MHKLENAMTSSIEKVLPVPIDKQTEVESLGGRVVAMTAIRVVESPNSAGVWKYDDMFSHVKAFWLVDRSLQNGRCPDLMDNQGQGANMKAVIASLPNAEVALLLEQGRKDIRPLQDEKTPMFLADRFLNAYGIQRPDPAEFTLVGMII